MNRECGIVRDLLPLYAENMASEESVNFINEHLKNCHGCRSELDNMKECGSFASVRPSETGCADDVAKPFKKIMKRMKSRFYFLAYSIIILLIFLGFAWTAGNNIMYNSIIMPIVGVFGYYVFRSGALYKMPIILLLIDLFVYACGFVEIDFLSALLWTLIYSMFVFVGIAIAYLLHFAVRKEQKNEGD